MKTPVFVWKNGGAEINTKFAFKMVTEMGLPLELVTEWINEFASPGSNQRAILIAEAYDEAHGTKTAKKIKELINENTSEHQQR